MSEKKEEKKTQEEDFQIYEVGFHLLPTLSADEVKKTFGDLREKIGGFGGEDLSEEFPRRIALAYEMEKRLENKIFRFTEGYFGWIKFSAPAQSAEQIGESFRGDDRVIRSLLVKTVRDDLFFHKGEEGQREEDFETFETQGEEKEKPANEEERASLVKDDGKEREERSEKDEKEKVNEEELDEAIEEMVK